MHVQYMLKLQQDSLSSPAINITLGLFAFVALAGDQVPYVLFAWGVLSIGYFIFIDVGAYLYFRVISPRCKKADSIETQQLIANEKGSAPEVCMY